MLRIVKAAKAPVNTLKIKFKFFVTPLDLLSILFAKRAYMLNNVNVPIAEPTTKKRMLF